MVTCVLSILSELLGIGLEVNDHETINYYNSNAVHSRKKDIPSSFHTYLVLYRFLTLTR